MATIEHPANRDVAGADGALSWRRWGDLALNGAALLLVGMVSYRYLAPQDSAPLGDLAGRAFMPPGRASLVELGAAHCPACFAMGPAMAGIEREYGARVRVLRVDLDRNEPEGRRLADLVHLHYTPTFVVTNAQGRPTAKFVGPTSYAALSAALESALVVPEPSPRKGPATPI